mmetsp:Transcript_22458/g.21599  ORF Transcript_22458/g.21599 Transcript_22458/m.21599 type:complete len:190 (-) Transcript_22458:551-1120(-)|eukprot:CAMPEP_0170547678 /NCGR_PEP_ID=MMETSP0211-20121228/6049_1 /TAXON_ID=311385 /ORGANISM="Pseudokeronopsis sp., Strain OXSARD2" /LENGTH=189 /DNA_ID=CAMNT_0010852829 /DNA_START=297 /DNA_END=866 /DNA_ORIENTATION=+
MTAINIPDMCQIILEHGLVPVPLDIDMEFMHPYGVDVFKSLINEKTVCVLFAYLFGIRYDISEYLEVLKGKNIDFVEDIAQSFEGCQHFNGTSGAVLSMFSFGMIKAATSFYGSMSIVRELDLYQKMHLTQKGYPFFTSKMYMKRVLTGMGMQMMLNHGPVMKAAFVLPRMLGKEREDYLISFIRGFVP